MYRKATLKLLLEELTKIPELYFNGNKLSVTATPHRDLQITTEKEAPTSGASVNSRLRSGVDISKPCTMLTADITGMESKIGYNDIRLVTNKPTSLEKVELEIRY